MSKPSHALRKFVLFNARQGDYASAGEIAVVASVSRQTACRWLREDGIDLAAARIKYLAKLCQAGQEQTQRLQGAPRMTNEERHRQMAEAVRRLNAAQTKRSTKKPR